MSNTTSAGTLLQDKYAALLDQKIDLTNDASIENTVVKAFTNNTSIETTANNQTNNQELPQAIKDLITGSDFWVLAKTNRYKKLIREGHLDKLLKLAEMAHTKNNPANWFAKACSKATWERTLAYFAKLQEVAQKADKVARRIGTSVNKFIYKQIWKGVNVERWAIQAEEVGHSKPGQSREKHFAWLCLNEKTMLANVPATS